MSSSFKRRKRSGHVAHWELNPYQYSPPPVVSVDTFNLPQRLLFEMESPEPIPEFFSELGGILALVPQLLSSRSRRW